MAANTIIELKDADIFQREELILGSVEMHVEEGEFVYIIGRVGTGKSSLIKTLNGEIPLVTGTGNVAGYNLNPLRPRDFPMLRRKLGVIFQDFRLLNDRSVMANLEFVLKATGWKQQKQIIDRVSHVLEQVGMEKQMMKMPHRLSGGEQQRVVIARAMLNDPPVILADEPTGNLDPETGRQIMEIFKKVGETGTTVIMITHNLQWPREFPGRIFRCVGRRLKVDCDLPPGPSIDENDTADETPIRISENDDTILV